MPERTVHIAEGSIDGFPDTSNFIESIPTTLHPATKQPYFDQSKQIIVTRAPGRLDVMGGIADYSGSLVLQLPIAHATHVAIQRVNAPNISIFSASPTTDARHIELSFDDFLQEDTTYDEARSQFSRAGDHWAAYIAGAFLVLMREREIHFQDGAKILIQSEVPEGKGVSSSAAVEVATMKAICVAFGIKIHSSNVSASSAHSSSEGSLKSVESSNSFPSQR